MSSKRKVSRRQSGAPTIADVAQHAGVSPMTVSRVINNESNVRSTTRDVVTASIAELGYSPNLAARSLAGADQIHVGMLYDDARTTYVSAFLIGGLQQTSRMHVQLTVKQCVSPEEATAAIRSLAQMGVDGVVLPAPISDWAPVLAAIEEIDIPTVLVATGRPHSACSAVGIDDYHAAQAMVSHLLELGHRRIGFIAGDPNQEASERRLQGFRAAIRKSGLELDEKLIVQGFFTYRSGLDAAEKLFELAEKPTAVFASNDDMAAATVAMAHKLGLDVPADVSVCGFDDTALAQTIWPELTTIHQPIEDMSRTAVDHLVARIRARREGHRAERRHILLDFTLVRRQSCAPPAK